MNDSKIRRSFTSPEIQESKYNDYSSLPSDSNAQPDVTSTNRFYMSVQRKDLSETKKAYVESTRPPQVSVENPSPKGLYLDPYAKVVDEYASNSDWRSRIQQAVAESDQRLKSEHKGPTPWPEAPAASNPKPLVFENLFDENESESDSEEAGDILWEIDDKAAFNSTSPDVDKVESDSEFPKPVVREEAYEAWLAERNSKIKSQHAKLLLNVEDKQKKKQRSENYDLWMVARSARLSEEESCLKVRTAEKLELQKRAAAHDAWCAARETRLVEEDACLKVRVAEKQEIQKRAAVHDAWCAAREARLVEEDACLKGRVAEKQESQKRAAAHDAWCAARETRLVEEDACLKGRVAEKQERQKRAAAHDVWCAAREARLVEEDACLKVHVAEKQERQKRAATHDAWCAAREARLVEEDACLKGRVAEKQERQKRAAAHDAWCAARAVRLAEEEACLKAHVTEKRKLQEHADAYDEWLSEREERIVSEEAALFAAISAKKISESADEESMEFDYKEVEAEFEAVDDPTVSEIFDSCESGDSFSNGVEIAADGGNRDIVEIDIIDANLNVGDSFEIDQADAEHTDAADVSEMDDPDEFFRVSEGDDYDHDLRVLLNEKKSLEKLRSNIKDSETDLDDEFIV